MEILDRSAVRRFSKVRLVGEGHNEICTISESLTKAEDLGLDLVLVSDQSTPPVVRIQDFKKIQYEKKKNRKAAKRVEVKEIRFMANISDHDFETKVRNIEKFLAKGNKVKVSVRLKGRERESPERADQIIERIRSEVECKLSRVPGPMAIAILEPVK